MPRWSLLILLACALALAACGGGSGSDATSTPAGTPTVAVVILPRVQLNYGAGSIIAEVASTPEQQERGLGYRDSLFDRGGMLFDLHEPKTPFFWMKGMQFALDMVWVGQDKKVIAVTANIPSEPGVEDPALKHYSPPSPARYVLELNAGAAAQFGIVAGTQLAFEIPATLSTPRAGGTPAPSGLPPTPVIGAPQP